MKRNFIIAMGIIIALAVALIGYGVFLNYRSDNIITNMLDKKKVSLQGALVGQKEILPTVRKNDIYLSSDNLSDAISRSEGSIVEMDIHKNDHVRKGQIICVVSNEDITPKLAEINSHISKAQADVVRFQNQYNRYQWLTERKAIAVEKLEEVEANLNSAEAEVASYMSERQQTLNQQQRQYVMSPLDGEVITIYQPSGSVVSNGTPIALIGDFSHPQFKYTISDKDLSSILPLESGHTVTFRMDDLDKVFYTSYGADSNDNINIFQARIISVSPSLDVPAALRDVIWEIDNEAGILESRHYSNVLLATNSPQNVLAIPKEALLDVKKSFGAEVSDNAVFVVLPNGELEKRKIITGLSDTDNIEIISGLDAGEVVVISGKDGLHEGMKADISLSGSDDDG